MLNGLYLVPTHTLTHTGNQQVEKVFRCVCVCTAHGKSLLRGNLLFCPIL